MAIDKDKVKEVVGKQQGNQLGPILYKCPKPCGQGIMGSSFDTIEECPKCGRKLKVVRGKNG